MRVAFGWLVFAGAMSWWGTVPADVSASCLSSQQVVHLTDLPDPGKSQPAAYFSNPTASTGLVNATFGDVAPLRVDLPIETWAKPQRLIEQIESLRSLPELSEWASQTLELLDAISMASADATSHDEVLRQLDSRRRELPILAEAVRQSNPTSYEAMRQASQIFRIGYRMDRRLAVWNSISRLSVNSRLGDSRSAFSSAAHRKVVFPELDPSWADYLLLDEFKSAFESLQPDPELQHQTARRVLARIYSPVLKPEQATFVQQAIDPGVIMLLKRHATGTTNGESLLHRLEQFETHPSSRTGFNLNNEYQNLLWSDDLADQAVAQALDTHFRNANFRVAVSETLLNRMIPVMPTMDESVSESIQGARVTGSSQITNQVKVKLVPDSEQLMLRLETDGHVSSKTEARTNAFRILNVGEARVQVFKRFAIGRNGISSTELPYSHSSANQSVIGVESKMDDIPIMGWVARRLAERKLKEKDSENDQLFRRKVARSAEARVQQEVESQLDKLRRYVYANLIQPMIKMELEPHPYQMATTDDQVVIRYRLAGRDQMAAHTSRPQDAGDNLLSFQLHQSAINNAIARLGLNGETFTTEELAEHLRDVIGLEPKVGNQPERHQPARFSFARYDPIRIDFVEDRVNIVLNLKSLKVGKNGKTWKYLTLTTSFRLRASGMQILAVQIDDGGRIKGKKRLRLGDKAAIGTVLNVLFQEEYTINALPDRLGKRIGSEAMEVSQLVVSDGWLAVSIDDRANAPVRRAPETNSRTGAKRRLKHLR